jgi:hypothetical protein
MLAHRLSRVLIVGVLFASVTASLGTAPAMARIKKPGLDSVSQECFRVQTASDKLIAEYKNASNARRDEILTELRKLGSYWRAAGCQALFGNIAKVVLPTNDFHAPPASLSSVGAGDGGSTPAGGSHQSTEPPLQLR